MPLLFLQAWDALLSQYCIPVQAATGSFACVQIIEDEKMVLLMIDETSTY